MPHTYKDLIFTKHAYNRLKERSIAEHAIWEVIHHPAQKFPSKGQTKFIKAIHDRKIHVVAKRLEPEDKWLIISVWVRGEEDKEPILWRLLILPFKILWWLIKMLWKLLVKIGEK